MAYHFRNLVFEGGGVRGIAYAGALEVMEEEKNPSENQARGWHISWCHSCRFDWFGLHICRNKRHRLEP